MTPLRLIMRTMRHFMGSNLATAAGIAIATAVVCGALIIGNSLQMSLERIVAYRLGNISHTITAGERIFTKELGSKTTANGQYSSAPVLKTEAIASIQGSNIRINKVDVWGIDSQFDHVAGKSSKKLTVEENEIVISRNLAGRLMADTGDFILLRMRKIGPIPSNTPFVAESEQTITRRVKIVDILDKEELGHLSMQATQSSPLNAFVNIDWLNRIMDLEQMANMIVVNARQETSTKDVYDLTRKAWQLEDGGIILKTTDSKRIDYHDNRIHLTSDRVFIDHYLSEVILNIFDEAIPTLTYFVNSLEHKDKSTPYSFVTAIDRLILSRAANETHGQISTNEWTHRYKTEIQIDYGQVVINQWLADDLGIYTGDSLLMRYYEIGPLRELYEREENFIVSYVLPMQWASQDSVLMPHLPGLSDAGNCRDWEAGIPIDLDAIRQKDEDYWDKYKGTPKAYIALDQGQRMWQNRFGNLTAISIPNDQYSEEAINNILSHEIDPKNIGFMVNAVREKGHDAARGSVDFGQLFAALGIFIIISGLLLTALLLSFSLKQRESQVKLFVSLGFPRQLVRKIMVLEALGITLTGVIAGVFISIAYSKAVFSALNHNWYDIVRTDTLALHIQPASLAFGFLISMVLGMLIVYWGIHQAIIQHLPAGKSQGNIGLHSNQDSPAQGPLNHPKKKLPSTSIIHVHSITKKSGHDHIYKFRLASFIFFMASVLIVLYLMSLSQYDRPLIWLFAGILLMLTGITQAFYFLNRKTKKSSHLNSLSALGWRNLNRNPLRSFTTILLLAVGSFVIVTTAANRKEATTDDTVKLSGTGGFQYIAETTVPILRNLNLPETHVEFGLPENVQFVQFLSAYDDDASCLNLNMVANPRILATDPAYLESRFSFVSSNTWLNKNEPWKSLDSVYQGIVPAVADQSVIQWGLGKKVGDTLVYVNVRGEEVQLLLIGGLANSVFQGNVIISSSNFMTHFPENGGSDVVLIEAFENDRQKIEEELEMIFRDYGWEMTSTLEKLAGFNSVENTYLQIFFLMGAFAMLLGTIGLVVIMAKSMIERRSEIALLRTLGYRMSHLIRLFFQEYTTLFIAGILIGTISALLATLPNFLMANQNISADFISAVLLVLIFNGLIWMIVIPVIMIGKIRLLHALRND
jgi:putative ABC transport system permease protein